MAFTALYDACVLYPAPLRDLLMQLALSGRFRAKWTNAIHDEWIRSLLRERPDLRPEQLERTRALMNAHVRDCLVENYESLISGLSLPDPDDRHVSAAAIRARADVIVTFNLKDFPADVLKPYGLEAQHPDKFIAHLIDLDPEAVALAVKACHARLKYSPNHSLHRLVKNPEANGLLFEAIPKAQYTRDRMEQKLSKEARDMEATERFKFHKIPDRQST